MKRLAILAAAAALVVSTGYAADTKISALPAASALSGTEAVPAVQSSATVKTTPAAIDTYVKTLGATLGVAKGGTNLTSATDDAAIVGNGTTWQASALPNCGDSTHALAYATSTNAFSCQAITATGTPGGSTTQVQFNNAGALGGDADFVYDSTNNIITLGSVATPGFFQAPSNAGAGVLTTVRGGATSGAGNTTGGVTITSGTPADGNTGSVTVRSADAVGTNRTAGNVFMTAGAGTGSGSSGQLAFVQAGNERLKIGTAGNLQIETGMVDLAHDSATQTTGFTYTFGVNIWSVVIHGAGTLATGTINMPATAASGRIVCAMSDVTITALTVSGNGNTIVGAPTTMGATTPFCMMFDVGANEWLRRS